MIWLASFPRSGNTFVRNILKENYLLESSSYHLDDYELRADFADFPFVKTHLLPHQLPNKYAQNKSIYILRDGRDCIVSLAHYRRDLIDSSTDLHQNMVEAIQALQGSFLGGWHNHTIAWIRKADVIIRYEDLLQDPLGQIEKIGAVFNLPPRAKAEVSGIEKYRVDQQLYGSHYNRYDSYKPVDDFGKKFFRKGIAGSWREEMPQRIQDFFWARCGESMEMLGYERAGSHIAVSDFDDRIRQIRTQPKKRARILVDISKMADEKYDGVKRYVYNLVTQYQYLQWQDRLPFEIDLFLHKKIMPLDETVTLNNLHLEYENKLLDTKEKIKNILPKAVYRSLRFIYLKMQVRRALARFRELTLEKRWSFTKIGRSQSLKELLNSYALVHITLPQHMIFFKNILTTQLVTVHDLTHRIFPDYHTEDNRQRSQTGFEIMQKLKTNVLAVSHRTNQDMELYYPWERSSRVIYEGVDFEKFGPQYDRKRAAELRLKYGIGEEDYFFTLFTLEPRKNLRTVMEAFLVYKEKSPTSKTKLVVGGRKGWKADEMFKDHPDICYTGYIEDVDLAVLYSEAVVFCYLSIYEGFGLPPLESMACHTPVIYAANSSLQEILKDYAYGVAAKDVAAVAEAMERFASDQDYRTNMARRAYQHALGFTWLQCAHETLLYYRDLINIHEKQ